MNSEDRIILKLTEALDQPCATDWWQFNILWIKLKGSWESS